MQVRLSLQEPNSGKADVPIIEVSSSDTLADLLPDHNCRDRCIVVSVFTVTCSIILVGYMSSLLYISVCPM
jgi:hypothetical protein